MGSSRAREQNFETGNHGQMALGCQDTEKLPQERQTIKLKLDDFGYLASSFCATKGTVNQKLQDKPQTRRTYLP